MHELSIAEAVLGIVLDHAGERRVSRVEVRVGALRQVVPEALQFAFELLVRDTVAEDAELELESVEASGRCRGCGAYSSWRGFPLRCHACGGLEVEIRSGEELLVEAIEVTDELSEVAR